VDTVELSSRRGTDSDDDWDDTSEEPVLLVHRADEGAAERERPDPCAAPGGPPADPGRSSSGPRIGAARSGATVGHTLAVLIGLLGLATGAAALWLTAAARTEVEQVQASLGALTAPAAERSGKEIVAAGLAELSVALERLQKRVVTLERVTDRALGMAEPAASPAGGQGGAPVFDRVWQLDSPGPEGLTAVVRTTELAAAWSEVRWPDVSFRPCALGHDGACGDGGEGGR